MAEFKKIACVPTGLVVATVLLAACASDPAQADGFWDTVVLDPGGKLGTWISLAVFPSCHPTLADQPAISYLRSGTLGYSWFDGSEWNDCVVDDEGGSYTSLAIFSPDHPTLACRPAISYYVDTNRDLKYAELRYGDDPNNPDHWDKIIVDPGAYTGGWTSLAILPMGHPLVPGQPAISYVGDSDLRFGWRDAEGTIWHTTIVDDTVVIGHASLAILRSGQPAISYFDETDNDLKYAWHEGDDFNENWHHVTVDSAGNVGQCNSLAILTSGQPAISYFDETNDSLKYAFAIAGDVNCDGTVDGFDIDPFVLLVQSVEPYEEYYTLYPDCNYLLGDVNSDGAIDAFDIDPFVELLTGG